jgi:hypothetical protein
MGLIITGITASSAETETEAQPAAEAAAPVEFLPDPTPALEAEPAAQELRRPELKEPTPNFEERSFTLVGRALSFVMKNMIPGAWQAVVQEMAGHMPSEIKLEPATKIIWEDESRHQQIVEELRDQGFVEAGLFRASSMDATLHLLVNEAYDIRAVVYEHGDRGIVLDLVTLYGDGTGITYVNREDPGYEQSPLHPNMYLGNIAAFELLDICLRERPKKAGLPVSPSTAAKLTELEYAFGAKRLRGDPVNPVEIADAYFEVIENMAPMREAVPEKADDSPRTVAVGKSVQ